ncbi:Zinc finger, BED-type [Sesbania bispinosa]|nr:Zinc finger, BED-type [Sesbania bispinosa]
MSSLGDPMDSPLHEIAGHSISTMPVASGTAAMLPPCNNRSTAWDHFTIEFGVEKKARCNYCGGIIKYKDGTSEGKVGGGVGSSPTYFKFDQELCQTELVKMFVVAELPFRLWRMKRFASFWQSCNRDSVFHHVLH